MEYPEGRGYARGRHRNTPTIGASAPISDSIGASRPLRVLLGMPFGTIQGGAERIMDDFVRRAGEIGVEPHVVFFEDGPWPDDLRRDGVPVTVVDPGRFRELRSGRAAFGQLRRLMKQEQPDVVFGWLARAHVTFAPAAVAAGHRSAWCGSSTS